MPNGMMLTIGMWSIIFAAGIPPHIVRLIGNTVSVDGANPKVHIAVAPLTTCIGIAGVLLAATAGIRQITKPISSDISNAYIDFSRMTSSLVAVVTNVERHGKRVIGYGFNSNGRYGEGG